LHTPRFPQFVQLFDFSSLRKISSSPPLQVRHTNCRIAVQAGVRDPGVVRSRILRTAALAGHGGASNSIP
jgi:hypothetical protein